MKNMDFGISYSKFIAVGFPQSVLSYVAALWFKPLSSHVFLMEFTKAQTIRLIEITTRLDGGRDGKKHMAFVAFH